MPRLSTPFQRTRPILFVALLLATFETAVLYFAGQSLENAVADSARLIRTGQAQQQGMTSDQFKQTICDQAGAMFDCTSGLKLDVKTFATFDSIDLKPPVPELAPQLRGAGACFLEGVAICRAGLGGRER